MTDEPAAIKATFSNLRLIPSRKVCQIWLELPIEEADAALAVLGGLPQPHSERWLGVARLNGVTKPEPEPKKGVTYGEIAQVVENAYYKTHPEEKEKQKWNDLNLAMQAGIRCNEVTFRKFLTETETSAFEARSVQDAEEMVRERCGVDSRRELNLDPEAAAKWRDLDRSYQAWLKVADA